MDYLVKVMSAGRDPRTGQPYGRPPYQPDYQPYHPYQPYTPQPYRPPGTPEDRYSWEMNPMDYPRFIRWSYKIMNSSKTGWYRKISRIVSVLLLITIAVNISFMAMMLYAANTNTLGRESTIEGMIRDENELPVEGAVIRTDWNDQRYVSDGGGNFRIEDAPSGAHTLYIESPNASANDVEYSQIFLPGYNHIQVIMPSKDMEMVYRGENNLLLYPYSMMVIIIVFLLVNLGALAYARRFKGYALAISSFLTLPFSLLLTLLGLQESFGFFLFTNPLLIFASATSVVLPFIGLIYLFHNRELFLIHEGESDVSEE